MPRPDIDFDRWAPESAAYPAGHTGGVWDDFNQMPLIYSEEKLEVRANGADLVVGTAGVDGITFRFRAGAPGVWAHHGMENRYQHLAPDLPEFLRRWNAREVIL